MTDVTSTLRISLIDDVSGPESKAAAALKAFADQAAKVDAALNKSTLGDRFKGQLKAIGASVPQISAASKAWEQYAKAEGLAANRKDWTIQQVRNVKNWESVNKAAIRSVMGEERALEQRRIKLTAAEEERQRAILRRQADLARSGAGAHSGDTTLRGLAGIYIGHQFAHGAHQTLERYQEFDNQRRYAKAVMGLTDEQQEPLVQQALKGGATSRFNDIQWLEAQREFAARGYKMNQVRGFTPVAATLGTAFDKTLPESVRLIEGAMLGFGKDVSTFDKAMAAATRTADLQVKASKVSGMSSEDVEALYKYGAPGAKMAGLSEEAMLAFGGLLKKSNMGGDESGTAFRALATRLVSPTAEGRVAMAAAGVDFGKFQRAPTELNTEAFAGQVAQRYGVTLSKNVKDGVDKIFHNSDLLNDATTFVPAVTHFLQGVLGGKDAKSLKSIAGLARDFRQASAGGVDTMGLMAAMMEAMSKNKNLANAMFGSKQGGRIYAALGDPAVYKAMLDQIQNHSAGFAQNVADQRNAGYDGAVKQLQGAIATLESSIGRSLDAGGKGGALTDLTRAAARATAALSEANPKLLQAGAAGAALAAGFVAMKGAGLLTGGFGLKASATALDAAAAHLMQVGGSHAGGPGGASGPGGGAGLPGEPAPGGGKKPGLGWRPWMLAAGAVPTVLEAYDYMKMSPEERAKFDEQRFKQGHQDARAAGNVVRSIRDKLHLQNVIKFSDDNMDEDNEPSVRARAKTMERGAGWHARLASPPINDPYLGGERPAIDERARRGADDFRRDPEGHRGRAMMRGGSGVDTSGLQHASELADETAAKLAALNMSVSPQIDTSGLDSAIKKVHALAAAIESVGSVSAPAARPGSYRTAMSGSFTVDHWRRSG